MSDVVVPDAASAWNLLTGALGLAILPIEPMTGLSLLTGTVAVRMAREGRERERAASDELGRELIQTEQKVHMLESVNAMEASEVRHREKLLAQHCEALEGRLASVEGEMKGLKRRVYTTLACAALGYGAFRFYSIYGASLRAFVTSFGLPRWFPRLAAREAAPSDDADSVASGKEAPPGVDDAAVGEDADGWEAVHATPTPTAPGKSAE